MRSPSLSDKHTLMWVVYCASSICLIIPLYFITLSTFTLHLGLFAFFFRFSPSLPQLKAWFIFNTVVADKTTLLWLCLCFIPSFPPFTEKQSHYTGMGLTDEEYERRDKQHKRRKAASVSNIHAVGPVCGRPLNSDSSQSKAEDSGWAELHTLLLLLWQGGGVNRPGRLRKAGWTKAVLWVGGREKKMRKKHWRAVPDLQFETSVWLGRRLYGIPVSQSYSTFTFKRDIGWQYNKMYSVPLTCILILLWLWRGHTVTAWGRDNYGSQVSCVPLSSRRARARPRGQTCWCPSVTATFAQLYHVWVSPCQSHLVVSLCPSFQGQLCLCHQHLNDSLLIIVECFLFTYIFY